MPSLNHLVAYRRRPSEDGPAAEPIEAEPIEAEPIEAESAARPDEEIPAADEPDAQEPTDKAPRVKAPASVEPRVEQLTTEQPGKQETASPESPKSLKKLNRRKAMKRLSRLPSAPAPMSRAALTRRIQTARARAESRSRQVSTMLVVLAVILGAMAFWFAREAAALRGGVSAQNTALTDAIQTSELKGKVTDDVNTLFSYDYTDPTKADDAARSALTGKAVQQYDSLIAAVRQQGPSQKLVVTTTVTSSAVEILDGARARVLIFADQEDTRATTKDTTYAAAMLAVDVVRQGGSWRIANFDTLTG